MQLLVLAMLSNALVATGLALVPLILGRLGRSPALVHILWLVVLLKLVTPPIVAVPLAITSVPRPVILPVAPEPDFSLELRATAPQAQILNSLEPIAEYGIKKGDEQADAEARHHANSTSKITLRGITLWPLPRWPLAFLALVVTGALVCWCVAAVRIVRLQSLLGDLRPAPNEVQAQVHKVARQLGLNRPPTVWLAPGRVPPMLWALGWQARLLLPAGLWPDLDEGQRVALLTHELAHLKRKDHWVRWLDLAVTGLYWWHPVLWWGAVGSVRPRSNVAMPGPFRPCHVGPTSMRVP